MKYKQLTENERYTLSVLRKQGCNQAQIANALGQHWSTISREITRNSCKIDNAYRPSKVQKRTNGRRRRSK